MLFNTEVKAPLQSRIKLMILTYDYISERYTNQDRELVVKIMAGLLREVMENEAKWIERLASSPDWSSRTHIERV